MLLVKVQGLSLSNMGFVILLKSNDDERTLPIFIGGGEAQSIAIHLDKVEIPRPLTHDLLKNVIDCLECRLKRVVVNDIVESTFYAVLVFERDGTEFEVDARPSDAIALALRCGAPIFVIKKVMEKAGIVLEGEAAEAKNKPAVTDGAAAPTAMATLKHELEQAVSQERFEEAARLRDEIRRLEKNHAKN
jgi:bifunctional DNase/RNase